jgi:6-phosphogluconate dehydrogenase
MQLGMIGLGRMGSNMTARLERDGHDVKTYDPGTESTASTLAELRDQLEPPRAFWLMVPAGEITESTFQTLLELAEAGDAIVDGGGHTWPDRSILGDVLGKSTRQISANEMMWDFFEKHAMK